MSSAYADDDNAFLYSVRQSILDDFHEPPLSDADFLLSSVTISQQLPHISIAPQADNVFAYAFTGDVPFLLLLKLASFGICPAAYSHSSSVGNRYDAAIDK